MRQTLQINDLQFVDDLLADEPVANDPGDFHPPHHHHHPPKHHHKAPDNAQKVKIATSRLDDPLVVMLGPTPPAFSGGTGGWAVTDRPNNVGMTAWVGVSPLQMDLNLLIDNRILTEQYIHNIVKKLLKTGEHRQVKPYKAMAPLPMRVYGKALHPHSALSWVPMDPYEYGESIRRIHDGTIERQELTLHLVRFEDPDAVKVKNQHARHGGGGGSGGHGKRYVVKKNDTLMKISAHFYGDPHDWRRIARRNGIQNPRQLTAGRTIIIPGV